MIKPCSFCASDTDILIYLEPSYHSWVLYPTNPYPVCLLCQEAMKTSTIDLRISEKWKKLRDSREAEKQAVKASRRLERLSQKENVA